MKTDHNFLDKKPLLILAPMAGVTDLAFRLICKEYGADIVYSEMISATGLFYQPKPSLALAKSLPEDAPLFLQLFGSDPKYFAHAAKMISELPDNPNEAMPRQPEGIDINFGCPVKKVMKQGAGCQLMRDPKLSRQIIQAVLNNTELPVSIKIRSGIDKHTALEFLEAVADLDWKMVMVHGRTYTQGFAGPIDLELIKTIKELYPHKIVIANGGITSPEMAQEVLQKTNSDGLGIARGAWGNPWIFQQIKDFLTTGQYQKPTLPAIKKTALQQAELVSQIFEPTYFKEFRKHLLWYFKGFPSAKKTRHQLLTVTSVKELKSVLSDL